MALSINQNTAAFNAYRNLSVTQGDLSKSLEKLSSGFRINRAADDAAGLAISEGLRSQVNGLKQGSRNAQDGISVVQTAEGALTESHAILQRMRTLAVQASNDGALDDTAKGYVQKEVGELSAELTRIADTTTFNGKKLLDGNYSANFQVGAEAGEVIGVKISASTGSVALSASGLGVGSVNVSTAAGASSAINVIDTAIATVSGVRADLGAKQNRLDHTIKNLNVAVENLSASESRIRDTDMASEMVQFTRAQILSQAGTSMLSQANQIPQGVLSLLR